MSRLYHNEPLRSLPVKSHNWQDNWQPSKYSEGRGVIVEGGIEARSRHVIKDKTCKSQYYVLNIRPKRAHRRQFDSSGIEIEPNFGKTEKIRTGFLNSSYKTADKGVTDRLDNPELFDLLKCHPLEDITGCHPTGCLSLWIEEDQIASMELTEGDSVRIKTRGDGPFIDTITKTEGQKAVVANYAGGEKVGSNWTDKVMTVKGAANTRSLPQDQMEGVDEDEWDD